MVDEGFIHRMVADLKDAGVDKLLAQGAQPLAITEIGCFNIL